MSHNAKATDTTEVNVDINFTLMAITQRYEYTDLTNCVMRAYHYDTVRIQVCR